MELLIVKISAHSIDIIGRVCLLRSDKITVFSGKKAIFCRVLKNTESAIMTAMNSREGI